MRDWIVQRRLPGTRGANGCWADAAVISAEDAESALELAVGHLPDHMVDDGEFRVAPNPVWQTFFPQVTSTVVRKVELRG